jgi:hypothetical protein
MHSSPRGMATKQSPSGGTIHSSGISLKRKLPSIVISNGSRNVRRNTVVHPRPRGGGVPRMLLHTSSSKTVVEDNDDDEFDLENDALFASTLPSEAMLAFQSLQQSTDTSLSIPVSGTESAIRGVLDVQLHEWFTLSNSAWSTRMVEEQLQRLRQSNTLRTLALPATDRVVYITTSDYIYGLREIVTNHSVIMNTEEEKVNNVSSVEMAEWWITYLSRTPSLITKAHSLGAHHLT